MLQERHTAHYQQIRDAVRMVTNDRNIYAASMLAAGDADAMVTGVTRNYAAALNDVRTVIDPPRGLRPGDVISRVNHRPVEKPEQAHAVWSALRHAREISVDFVRGAEGHTLRFAIVDDT